MEDSKYKNKTEYIPRVRLTKSEKRRLMEEYEKSYHRSLAAFVREKLFMEECNLSQKERIETLRGLGQFQTELSRLGNNVNQVAKALNTYKQGEMRPEELRVMQELIPLFNQILNQLHQVRF